MTDLKFQKVLEIEQVQIVDKLAHEIWHEHFTSIIGLPQVEYMLHKFQSKDSIMQQITDGCVYFLIKKQQVNIGYLAFKFQSAELYLSKLYIKAAYRRKGYGGKAIQFLNEVSSKNDIQAITLNVNKNNFKAITAYKNIGFEIIATKIQDIGGGFVMDDYVMQQRL